MDGPQAPVSVLLSIHTLPSWSCAARWGWKPPPWEASALMSLTCSLGGPHTDPPEAAHATSCFLMRSPTQRHPHSTRAWGHLLLLRWSLQLGEWQFLPFLRPKLWGSPLPALFCLYSTSSKFPEPCRCSSPAPATCTVCIAVILGQVRTFPLRSVQQPPSCPPCSCPSPLPAPPPSPFSSSGTLFKCKSDHVRRVTFFKGYFQTHRGGLFSAKVEPKAISKITTYHMISPHTPLCLNFLPHSLPFTPFEPHSPLLVFPFTDQVSFASRPCTCCCFCLDVLPLGISLACRESS